MMRIMLSQSMQALLWKMLRPWMLMMFQPVMCLNLLGVLPLTILLMFA